MYSRLCSLSKKLPGLTQNMSNQTKEGSQFKLHQIPTFLGVLFLEKENKIVYIESIHKHGIK